VNCGQGERCSGGSCVATGRCGEGFWSCSGDCTRTKDVYRCDGSNSCIYDVGDDAETAPVGQWCSGGSFTSSGVCDYSVWSCDGECRRVQDEYRCDASQSCAYDVGDNSQNAPSGQICSLGSFAGGSCGNCGDCSGGVCTGEGCAPGSKSPDCPCSADGCQNGDYYVYPDDGDCTGACACDTGEGPLQPCEPISISSHDQRCYNIPTVTTDPANPVKETTATLNGTLNDDGGEPSSVRFQYGLTVPAYGTDTTWQSGFVTGNTFSQAISGLSKGTLYHFRAQAQNVAGTGNGLDSTFLTKPDEPFNFTAIPGNSQIILSWIKGAGANNACVMRGAGSCPSSCLPATAVYLNVGTSFIDTGVSNGTTYCYRAWSEVTADSLTQYSDAYGEASATPAATTICDSHDVWGWAWSSNVGWISFSCTSGSDYGVDINGSTGVFSGYAWSSNVGWISFNETELVGCPSGTCQTRLDFTSAGTYCDAQYNVCGWAKVLSDGSWIRLRDTNYGISWNQSNQEMEGWAWSDTAIGWISFNHLNCDSNDDGVSDGLGNCPPAGTLISDYKVMALSESNPPTVSVEGAPASWQNTDATADVSCVDDSGCDTGSYRLITYASDPGSCSTTYGDYTLLPPQTISSHQWICGAALDLTGNAGFSTPSEFQIEKAGPNSQILFPDSNSWFNAGFTINTLDEDLKSGLNLSQCQYKVLSYDCYPPVPACEHSTGWLSRTCNTGQNITVGGVGEDCGYEGEEACLVYVRSQDNAGNWHIPNEELAFSIRRYNIDWTDPSPDQLYITENEGDQTYPIQVMTGEINSYQAHVTDNIKVTGCNLYINNDDKGAMELLPVGCDTDCTASTTFTFVAGGTYSNNYVSCEDAKGNIKAGSSVNIEAELQVPPQAQIDCYPDGCLQFVGACQGYTLSLFCLKNESTDPSEPPPDIQNSEWAVYNRNTGGPVFASTTCFVNPLCNWTLTLGAGNYKAVLKVTDNGGLTDTTSKDFDILQNAIADFMCSLTEKVGSWQNCENINVSEGEVIYFKDDLGPPFRYSSPSAEANSIDSRTWEQNGIIFSSDNEPDTFITVDAGLNKIELTITDDKTLEDSTYYTINVTLPLPEWKEISPP